MTPLSDIFRVFGRIGLLSFGGPAAQIALMHKELVDTRPWLTEAQFLRALSFCMMLPGPEAMQLATYCGWRLRGTLGGVIAGALFVLPGAAVIAALAALYTRYGTLPWVQALFLGVQAVVVVIVAQAILRLARKTLKTTRALLLAVGAFVALYAFGVPFPAVVAVAALVGAAAPTPQPGTAPEPAAPTRLRLGPSVRAVALFGTLWALPLGALWAMGQSGLLTLGLFFSKLAVVSFGGAYALLAYMTQAVVDTHGWLSLPQMIDALGLAETTPGPLILVTQFVGHLAGSAPGMGGFALAGALTLWVTFVPCFLWIFAGAPLIDWLEHQPRLAAALSAITAAVLGVIANLALWFTLHVLFDAQIQASWGPVNLTLPHPGSLSWPALALTALAALLTWRGVGIPLCLAICALAGLGLGAF